MAQFIFTVYDDANFDQYGNLIPLLGATVSVTKLSGADIGSTYAQQTGVGGIAVITAPTEGAYYIEVSHPTHITKTYASINLGDGGGLILELDVYTPPPPPAQSSAIWIAIIAVFGIIGLALSGEKKKPRARAKSSS